MVEVLGPKKRPGNLAPLFDRLTDLSPHEPTEAEPWGFLSPTDLKNSILEELERLFNSRASNYADELGNLPPGVCYGVPSAFGLRDLSELNGNSKASWRFISGVFEDLIRRFEPRLKSPSVTVTGYDSLQQKLFISISGTVHYTDQMERVSFPLEVS